ncbi:hypothetical protein Cgig2_015608 [Carnegiea gigantea]|uniref:Uncharacterized protein n=1 Tax=Carnegiea gigantea TaxID=171969 RepID=A0A9Q1JND3_9CARY|nr:hypothetical protein Cgig2_015608 [Carnegiea gigantea]
MGKPINRSLQPCLVELRQVPSPYCPRLSYKLMILSSAMGGSPIDLHNLCVDPIVAQCGTFLNPSNQPRPPPSKKTTLIECRAPSEKIIFTKHNKKGVTAGDLLGSAEHIPREATLLTLTLPSIILRHLLQSFSELLLHLANTRANYHAIYPKAIREKSIQKQQAPDHDTAAECRHAEKLVSMQPGDGPIELRPQGDNGRRMPQLVILPLLRAGGIRCSVKPA